MRLTWLVVSFLVVASLAYSQAAGPAPTEGRIIGTVLDELGQPIEEAQVCTDLTSAPRRVSECNVRTDKTGQFQIDQLAMGTYEVNALKFEDGYQDFGPPGHLQRITITPQSPLADVIFKLGPREGILIPSVRDKVTGKVLRNFCVQWKTESTGNFRSGSMLFSVIGTQSTVPAEQDLTLTAAAKGYKTWVYADPSDPSRLLHIRVRSGEHKALSIELEPEAKVATKSH